MNIAHFKKLAAERAVEFVESGMIVGLGVGSTAVFAVRRIADLMREGQLHDVQGVPCSLHIEAIARELCIPLTTLDEHPVVDLTIDGADEVDPSFNLIKGGGGALLREKMVAQASRREIIVVDETKRSEKLGMSWAVPIEVLEFGWRAQVAFLAGIGGKPVLRLESSGTPYYTDQGNLILDTDFGPIDDVPGLSHLLNGRAGIVEHGLFVGLATDVVVAGVNGIELLQRAR
jgi:ribose 5-phosphate isomerase A